MAWVGPNWRFPSPGYVKVNVHGFFSDEPLPNGNRSGIGVVIMNSRGKITRLYAGSLCIEERRTNELYALLEGLIRAYLDHKDFVEIETDNIGAYFEWTNSLIHEGNPDHRYVLQQLNQRKGDHNLSLKINPVDADANPMAIYLARHGARSWKQMVIITNPFGRIYEIWCNDIGLGPVGEQFAGVVDVDLEDGVMVAGEGVPEVGHGVINRCGSGRR